MRLVSLKVLEATFFVGVETKCPTRNPVYLQRTPVKVCGVCFRRENILDTARGFFFIKVLIQLKVKQDAAYSVYWVACVPEVNVAARV